MHSDQLAGHFPQGDCVPRSVVRGFSGARLRSRRTERGMTTEDLADIAGVSAPIVSGWESGRYMPTPHLLARVADALRITIADLVVLKPGDVMLSDLRIQAGLTQSDAGAALGLSPSTIGRVEKGRKELDEALAGELAALYGIEPQVVRGAWMHTLATRAARLESF